MIKNEGDNYSGSAAYSYSDGVLTIDHSPISNIDDIDQRSTELEKFLSAKM